MLSIRETYCQQGKLSNNLEMHGEEEVTAFDIPISGITLTGEEVNALLEDPYADRWIFNNSKDVRESNVSKFHPLQMIDAYEQATVVLTMSTGAAHTFANCKITKVTLEPKRGGEVIVGFSLRLRPENEQQILDLIEHQHHSIKIDVQEGKIALKGGRKQQELPLNRAGADEEADTSSSGDTEGTEELTHPEQLFTTPKGKRGRGKSAH